MATNKALVREFLTYGRDHKGWRSATLDQYRSDLLYLLAHLGDTPLGEATLEQLEAYVATPVIKSPNGAGEAPSASTRKRRVYQCRALWRWLFDRKKVPNNVAVGLEPPKVRNRNPQPTDTGVWRSLWASDLCDSDRVAFGLLMFCGMRRFEVTDLRLSQVEAEVLRGVTRKGGNAADIRYRSMVKLFAQKLPDLLPDESVFFAALRRLVDARHLALAEALQGEPAARREEMRREWRLLDWRERAHAPRGANMVATLPRPSEWWFNPDALNRRFRAALRNAGHKPNVTSPHKLRHAFCTRLIGLGLPAEFVAEMAGHADINMTIKTYTHLGVDPVAKYLAPEDDGDDDWSEFSRHVA